jgi:hypothetical protein
MGSHRFAGTLRNELGGATHSLVSAVIANELADAPPQVIRRQLDW